MEQGFVLHRRSRPTADSLLVVSDQSHSILIEIHPAKRPVLTGGTTLGALNVYLGALDRLGHSGACPVAIHEHWVERKPGRMPGNNAHLCVLAQLNTDRNGLASLRRCLGQAAVELEEPICFDYGLGLAIPTGRRHAEGGELSRRAAPHVRDPSQTRDLALRWQADISDNPGLMLVSRLVDDASIDPWHRPWRPHRDRDGAMFAASDHLGDRLDPWLGLGRFYMSLIIPPAMTG